MGVGTGAEMMALAMVGARTGLKDVEQIDLTVSKVAGS